jgi:hypothetical protein
MLNKLQFKNITNKKNTVEKINFECTKYFAVNILLDTS